MKTRMAQTLILAAMLATAPLVMAVDCGPMGYHGIKSAIRFSRPPIPPVWSADGRLVLYNKDAAMHWIAVDGTSSKSFPHGEEPTLERVSYGCRGGGECPPPGKLEHAFDLSTNGVIAFNKLRDGGVDQPVFDVGTIELDGSDRKTLQRGRYPSWSPDGTRIAFFDRDGLRVISADGSDLRYVIKDADYLFNPVRNSGVVHAAPPVWSPDGQHIAFLVREPNSDEMVPREMYTVHASGNDLTLIGKTITEPAWSPDSERLAFAREEGDIMTIYTVRRNGEDQHLVTSFTAPPSQASDRRSLSRGRMTWSPYGSQIRMQTSPFVTVNSDGTDLRFMVFPWDMSDDYQEDRAGYVRNHFAAYASWSPNDAVMAVSVIYYDRIGTLTTPLLFTMVSGQVEQILVGNSRWPQADQSLIEGLRWIDREEYASLMRERRRDDPIPTPAPTPTFTAERAMINIPRFDWESHPSVEVEQ